MAKVAKAKIVYACCGAYIAIPSNENITTVVCPVCGMKPTKKVTAPVIRIATTK